MRVLQLIDSLAIGGAERMAVNMSCAMFEEGIENTLVCTRDRGPLIGLLPQNISCLSLNKTSAFDIIAFFRLLKLVYIYKPTIIHAHSSSLFWGVAVKMIFFRIKLVWHDHNGNRINEKNWSYLILLKAANGIVVVNQELLEWARVVLPRKKSVLIGNFPFLKLGNIENKRGNIILHLANLRNPKDHLTLVNAISLVKKKTLLPFEVWCVGKDSNDSYSQNIKQMIKDCSLEETIIILGQRMDIPSLLEQASIGVLSSSSEGLPVSLLEYGLAGLPAVVTNVGQCAEVVGNGLHSSVVTAGVPEELAEAIAWHINNADESKQLGTNFKKHVIKEYGSSKFLREYLEFINSI